MVMKDDLLAAFSEFNDAAFAIQHCQLSQTTVAAERLEKARENFHGLFMSAVHAVANGQPVHN